MIAAAGSPSERDNPYTRVVLNDGDDALPDLSAAWAEMRALLSDGTYTIDELMDASELNRKTVKGLLYYGKWARKVLQVDTRRRVEVAPDVIMVRTVRGYRAPGR